MSQVRTEIPRDFQDLLGGFFRGAHVSFPSILEEELLVRAFVISPSLFPDVPELIAIEVEGSEGRRWVTTRSPYISNPFRRLSQGDLPVWVTFGVATNAQGNEIYFLR